ncbi:acetyl-CoA C-acetyltransferase [Acrasis kona]|uniref:acetyl-CoA C-acetyltransferase n=1 Tax=Acrasis kona TaxID=1008807 RepID=A0AAW2ZEY5_9EUKA
MFLRRTQKNVTNLLARRTFMNNVDPGKRPVIVAAVRTAIGSFNGKLSSFDATTLGALAIRGAIAQAGVSPNEVHEAYMGNVVQSNLGQAPGRQAVLNGGLPKTVCTTTLNKMCASGMKSAMLASQSVMLGINSTVIAGGFESMSNAPYYLPKVRFGLRYGDGQLIDGLAKDGLTDAYNHKPMGWAAEECAKAYAITRQEQDAYTIESYRRAAEATSSGAFKEEILSISVPGKPGAEPTYVNQDEEFANIRADKIPTLKPAFTKDPDGTVTAANSSKLSDGAAALIIMSEEKAKRGGFKVIGRILGFADAEKDPNEFTTAPADAIPKALKHSGINLSDVSYFEINEAFSVVALANMKILGLDPANVNIYGGAVALGHPIGCSGARIIVTLLNALKRNGKSVGVAAICNGGGGASSIVIERVN